MKLVYKIVNWLGYIFYIIINLFVVKINV